jgi:hypothetical protein
VRISTNGRNYFAGAAHFQFMAPKAILQQVLPIAAERPMGRVRLLDEAVDKAGFLRLTTETWHVQHLGNTLPQPGDLIGSALLPEPAQRRSNSGIWRWAPLRKLLQWLYGWSFDKLHRGDQPK